MSGEFYDRYGSHLNPLFQKSVSPRVSRVTMTEQIEMLHEILVMQGEHHQLEINQMRFDYEKRIHDLKFDKMQLQKVLYEKKDATPWYHLVMFFRRLYFETRDKIQAKRSDSLPEYFNKHR